MIDRRPGKANTCALICQRLTASDISIPEIGGSPGGVQRLFPSFAVSFPSPDNPLPPSTMSENNVFSGARNVIVSGAVSVPETVREALSYADAAVSTQIGCTEVVAPTTATPASAATTFLATTTLDADSAYLDAAAACHTDNAMTAPVAPAELADLTAAVAATALNSDDGEEDDEGDKDNGRSYHVPASTEPGPFYVVIRGLQVGIFAGWWVLFNVQFIKPFSMTLSQD